jgi:hypothetical protein
MSFLAFLLVAVVSTAPSFGGNVYLYDESVAGAVDLGHFTSTGEVAFLRGISNFGEVNKGPAPAPYPQVAVWEPDYEFLGASSIETDGMWFINLGKYWVKNKMALVLWKIRVPNANARMLSEFEEDFTLSLWVDWDENEMWEKDELMIRKHLDIDHRLPTDDETVVVYYLTGFKVPDITNMASSGCSWWKGWNHEIKNFWIRGSLAYDDSDVSPDGNQLFGEVEDYRIGYKLVGLQKGYDD